MRCGISIDILLIPVVESESCRNAVPRAIISSTIRAPSAIDSAFLHVRLLLKAPLEHIDCKNNVPHSILKLFWDVASELSVT